MAASSEVANAADDLSSFQLFQASRRFYQADAIWFKSLPDQLLSVMTSSHNLGFAAVLFWIFAPLAKADEPRVIHAFIALCDNASQGIVPVPAKIGNGDDLVDNLYWGCDDAILPLLKRSKAWKKLLLGKPPDQEIILERAVYLHQQSGAVLVADAYRGKEIKAAIRDYFSALAGKLSVEITLGERKISAGGKAGLVAYLGHDGLMEFPAEVAEKQPGRVPAMAVALCCKSQDYFKQHIESTGAKPILLTTQLMYPGGFLLLNATEAWIGDAEPSGLLQRVAASYAKNQGISQKSAAGVFWVPEKTPK